MSRGRSLFGAGSLGLLLATNVGAQGRSAALSHLDDEFSSPATLARWSWHHATEGWPNQIRRIAIESRARGGQLILEPQVSAWYQDWHGSLLYKEVEGDFDVVTQVHARGLRGPVPDETWSLAGIMVRRPRPETSTGWVPGREDWLFITTGVGQTPGQVVIETKSTTHSGSELRLVPTCPDQLELRIIRASAHFFLLSRCPGARWVIEARFSRPDLPVRLQVGLTAYSGWEQMEDRFGADGAAEFNRSGLPTGRPGLRAAFDFVRFRRPVDRSAEWWCQARAATLPDAVFIQALGETSNR